MSCCKKNNFQEPEAPNKYNYGFIVLIVFILLAIVLGGTRYY